MLNAKLVTCLFKSGAGSAQAGSQANDGSVWPRMFDGVWANAGEAVASPVPWRGLGGRLDSCLRRNDGRGAGMTGGARE